MYSLVLRYLFLSGTGRIACVRHQTNQGATTRWNWYIQYNNYVETWLCVQMVYSEAAAQSGVADKRPTADQPVSGRSLSV